ncbi:MAG TPA: carbohydrate ABC transporter permease [Chloroflexota bacterium]
MKHRFQRLSGRTIFYLAVILAVVVVVFPSYWLFVTALQEEKYQLVYPPYLTPQIFNWHSFVSLFEATPMLRWLRNSVLVSLGVTVLALVMSILGAYSLSGFRFRGRGTFVFLLLVSQMMPQALLVVPIFVLFRQFGLLNSLQGLVLVDTAFVVPVTVWVMKGFFDSIPREILEAALMDGCSRMSVLFRILLPLSLPAIVAVCVVAFFDGWNEYLFAVTFVSSSENWVATIGLAGFIGELATPLELMMAAAAVFSIAPVIFYLLMQRYIVSGLTGGAVKG